MLRRTSRLVSREKQLQWEGGGGGMGLPGSPSVPWGWLHMSQPSAHNANAIQRLTSTSHSVATFNSLLGRNSKITPGWCLLQCNWAVLKSNDTLFANIYKTFIYIVFLHTFKMTSGVVLNVNLLQARITGEGDRGPHSQLRNYLEHVGPWAFWGRGCFECWMSGWEDLPWVREA